LDLATSQQNLASDLPQCPTASIGTIALGPTHNNTAGADFIKLTTDSQIVGKLDATAPGWVHQQQGYPNFGGPNNAQGWPTGLTVDHQVMHISGIKRAFDGGLRLMFASVTDDEILSKLWNQGFNLLGNTMPTHDSTFDYTSAVKQLTYITNLVNANSTWMQIVKTPSEARNAINSNKLAVVLSLEMDSLNLAQIQALVQKFGVAHVIPVHLADSSFGGTAIYSDLFNGLSNFINGFPENGVDDPNVNFRLATPVQSLEQITIAGKIGIDPNNSVQVSTIALVGASAFGPETLATVTAALAAAEVPSPTGGNLLPQLLPTGALGYQPTDTTAVPLKSPGQVNTRDLNSAQFFTLMQMGLLLDIAHMGQTSALTALNLAKQYHYPLMDSHTGIRCDSNCSTSSGSPGNGATSSSQVDERSLPTSQLQMLSDLGGVIGLGLVPSPSDPDPVTNWVNGYKVALSLMGGKRVALGTDANGLSPLLQTDTIPTNYPITVAQQFGCKNCVPLAQYSLGNRTYSFRSDGIANYGLLPDFIQAASQSRPVSMPVTYDPKCAKNCLRLYTQCVKDWNPSDYPRGTPSPCGKNENSCMEKCVNGGGPQPGPAPTQEIAALFHTAEDTIAMWETAESALLPTSSPWLVGTVGQAFSQLFTARGGSPPYRWSIGGSQTQSPVPGLTMQPGGTLLGKPATPGAFKFTAVVQDSSSPENSASFIVGLSVSPESCLQNPTHEMLLCGCNSTKTCVIPPASCPVPECRSNEVLREGCCVPKGSQPK
jgi:microsomal dipeptidase-like Zn-dependent dipeptidase